MNKKAGWKKVKQKVENEKKQDLIKLIADLYRESEDVQLFLNSRYLRETVSMKALKKSIFKALSPDDSYNGNLKWHEAADVVKNYRLASQDQTGVAELMVYYMEVANQFTLDYGDIDEDYYDTAVGWFEKTARYVKALKKKDAKAADFIERLRNTVDSTEGIGWGYHDGLCEVFFKHFE